MPQTHYPIDPVLPELAKLLGEAPFVILSAPPGSGKTTRAPIALLDAFPHERGGIVMLEPRRLAATSAARWMSRTLGEEVGGTVGYSIRFDRKVSPMTRIEVVTEGILTRRLQSDPGLDGVGLVIFDEFHERSIHADLGLALCLDVQRTLREDLKILVMSATLDTAAVSSMLGGAPVVSSEGRMFPVEERYVEARKDAPVAVKMADAVRQAIKETEGDILAFLPGAGEIRSCAGALEGLKGVAVHTLYGDMPFEAQERAIMPSQTRKKVVLATNIAETSLTIEGVRVVIDSGLARRLEHDPSRGMNRLVTAGISRSSAAQRKGRAGRLGPGICYRLYSRHTHEAMLEHSLPEIAIADLSSLVLELALWGIKEPSALKWLDPPPAASWAGARLLLHGLGALDVSGNPTDAGRTMARLPLHPRLARLALKAVEEGCPGFGADVAALLSEKEIIRRGEREPDISERLHVLTEWRRTGKLPSGADANALRAVDRTAKQILKVLGSRPASNEDDSALPVLFLCAYPERVGKRRDDGRYLLAQGRGVRLKGPSGLSVSPYIVALELDSGERGEGVVHMASAIDEVLIRRELCSAIETIRRVEWASGKLVALSEERLGAIVLSEKPFQLADEEAIQHLCRAISDDPSLIAWSDGARQFQLRVGLAKKYFSEEDLPDLSDERLLATLEDWLGPHLKGVRTREHLAKVNVLPALEAMLDWKARRRLDELAPTHIAIPSGRRAQLDYTAGELPVLAVKLQEMFGAADTPRIAGGRVGVLIHLLSPAGRPLQITQDLAGFWRTGYPEVRKEMRGRYPKHPWPDDPTTATPTARTKRKT